MKNKLSIIIPAKNEEDSIIQTLESIKKHVKVPYEIVVVNDFSTDKTKEIVKKYTEKHRNVSIVMTNQNQTGFSNAIRKGLERASGGIVVIVMADLCDDPETINKMYKKIVEGWDIVCGARYIKGGKKIGGPSLQNLFSALVCKSLYYIIGIKTKDSSNAFKMFRKKIIRNLEYKPNIGVEASLDFILRAYFRGLRMVDVPTTWRGRTIGQSKFKLIERSPKYIRIYVWALANRFKKIILTK